MASSHAQAGQWGLRLQGQEPRAWGAEEQGLCVVERLQQ